MPMLTAHTSLRTSSQVVYSKLVPEQPWEWQTWSIFKQDWTYHIA